MPRYMLDTNMYIYLMKNQPEQVACRFAQCLIGEVIISAITYAELEYGVTVSANRARDRRSLNLLVADIPVMAFDSKASISYGPVSAARPERKKIF